MKLKLSINLEDMRRDSPQVHNLIKSFKVCCKHHGFLYVKEIKPVPGFSRVYEFVFIKKGGIKDGEILEDESGFDG